MEIPNYILLLVTSMATVGLWWAAIKALDQINLTRDQVAIGELKDFGALLRNLDQLVSEYVSEGHKPQIIELTDFTLAEVKLLNDPEKKIILKNSREYFESHKDKKVRAISLMNQLEIISAVFINDIGSVDVVKRTMAFAFCIFVEVHAVLYMEHRHEAFMLYENTIKLYKVLKPVYGSQREQEKRFRENFIDTLKDSNKKNN